MSTGPALLRFRSVVPSVLLVAFAFASRAAPAGPSAASSPVRLQAVSGPVHEGEALAFNVHETVDGPVTIDSCAAVELESKNGASWATMPVKICGTPLPATQFDGDLSFSVPAPASGTYRATLTWGSGCAAGFPLATALCAHLGSVTSEAVVVAPKPQ